MDITDIQKCADFYKTEYMEKFYIITTFCGNGFVLVAEKRNFPHLMGIKNQVYKSNGYKNPSKLYDDIISGVRVSNRIISNTISTTSKMYKKALNFNKSTDIFWHNTGPLAVNYNETLSTTKLNNVSLLLVDISSGYMTGWIENTDILLNSESKLKKYCFCTWIDETGGSQSQKEKYMPSQSIEIIKNVLAFDKNSKLVNQKTYSYSSDQKREILLSIERNGSNLMLDNKNERYYKEIAVRDSIHCKINGITY
ncbi:MULTISPECIES: PBECR4 domain-containing protein [unclassified Clostridium]|uniref:PBECR4 domain-containing protein n=1 Tax=unclassified Clostridium TaxID=2614128 RepID=UPI001EEF2AC2|nr:MULTISPECIES: PBECR4 domain-containing protein [unclassified Clostridium]